jgi:hypothetical protein
MPKRVFWPLTLVIMGLIFLASATGLLPRQLIAFWPVVMIVVGLGGLLTADQEEWEPITFGESKFGTSDEDSKARPKSEKKPSKKTSTDSKKKS